MEKNVPNARHKNERVFVLKNTGLIQQPLEGQVVLIHHDAEAIKEVLEKYGEKVKQVHYHGPLQDAPDFRTAYKKVVKVFIHTKEEIIRHSKMLREQRCYICPEYPVEKIEDISLITSMGIAVDLLYKIDHVEKEVILQILDMYLHHPSLDVPVEPFHSILISKLKKAKLHLWNLHLMFPGRFLYIDETGAAQDPDKLPGNQNSLKKYFKAIPRDYPGCVSCHHFQVCFSWAKYKKDTCTLWKEILDQLQRNVKEIRQNLQKRKRWDTPS